VVDGRRWRCDAVSVVRALLIAALAAWAPCGALAWILRDGLGPDAVESHGWEALVRCFWTFHWGPVLALLGLMTVVLSRRVGRSTPEARLSPPPGATERR